MNYKDIVQTGVRISGGIVVLGGILLLILAPIIGENLFDSLWGLEPLAYIGAILLVVGFAAIAASYFVPELVNRRVGISATGDPAAEYSVEQRWSQVTQRYFDLFDHDLSRPLRRILGKERELRAVIKATGIGDESGVKDLLDEIERQAPSFRLMISNIRVLVDLEAQEAPIRREPVEPSQVVRRIIDRYTPVASESNKEISWWSEPSEFGIVYCDSSAIEHIVVNLVDNAVRYASGQVEVKLSKNPSHFFIRVWDDGPGISSTYLPHIFDHGWTPEVARREEKTSSGLGLFISRALAKSSGGDLTVVSVPESTPDHAPESAYLKDDAQGESQRAHRTEFLLSLPLESSR